MGLPDPYPVPAGWEKIVCTSALQAEFWSREMRKQESIREQVKDEEREAVEGPMRRQLRAHMFGLMANAKNQLNRDFLRIHLEKYDKRPDLTKTKRESYLHAEGFESGR